MWNTCTWSVYNNVQCTLYICTCIHRKSIPVVRVHNLNPQCLGPKGNYPLRHRNWWDCALLYSSPTHPLISTPRHNVGQLSCSIVLLCHVQNLPRSRHFGGARARFSRANLKNNLCSPSAIYYQAHIVVKYSFRWYLASIWAHIHMHTHPHLYILQVVTPSIKFHVTPSTVTQRSLLH